MIAIADSGSTKTDWVILDSDLNEVFRTSTIGFNPYFVTSEDITTELQKNEDFAPVANDFTKVFFYGAGTSSEAMHAVVKEGLENFFTNAEFVVDHDLLAACYATYMGKPAMVCILGTGSNCSYFDGKVLHQKVQSLGYIAMDDCSGNRFGRHLIRAYYFNKMPKELAKEFEEEYNVEPDNIKHNLYKEPNPNAYLATFAKFLIRHKDTEFCQKLIQKEMESFVENYIEQFENCKEVPVHFIGSIAFYLKDELTNVLEKRGITIGNVLRRPIDGLIEYHILNK